MNPPSPQWIEAYVRAGVRVLLKRALRAADIPFHHEESTADLMAYATRAGAPVEATCDAWVEIAQTKYGLTRVQSHLMVEQAKRTLIAFRLAQEAPDQGGSHDRT